MRPPRRSSTAKGPPTAGKPGTPLPEQDATGGPPDDPAADADQAGPDAGTPAQQDASVPDASQAPAEGTDPKPPSARLLSVAETAALFGCSRQAIRDRTRRGELTSVGTGRRLLFSEEEVQQKLEDQLLRRILSRRQRTKNSR